jgi:hypothetical protein
MQIDANVRCWARSCQSGMSAMRLLSGVNRTWRFDIKRVAEQTGILTKEPDHSPQEC